MASPAARAPEGVLRQSLTYSLGAIGYKVVALLTVPVLARVLEPAGLGYIDLASVVGGMIGVAAGLGFDQAVARRQSEEQEGELWSSALTGVAFACLLIAVASVGVLWLLPAPLESPGGAFILGVCYGFSLALLGVALNAIRLRGTPRTYAALSFAVAVTEALVAVAVAGLTAGAVHLIIVGWTTVNTLVATVVLWQLLPPLGWPRWAVLYRLAQFGLPLVPATLAWAVADVVIRTTIGHEIGVDAIGVFGIATRLTSVLMLVIAGFSVAWHPIVYRTERHDIGRDAERVLLGLLTGLGSIGVILASISPELTALVAGPRYAAAAEAVPALVLGVIGLGVFTLASAVHGFIHTTLRVGAASVIGALAQALLIVPAVRGLSLGGAGLAIAAGFWVAAALVLPAVFREMTHASRLLSALAVGASCVGLAVAYLLRSEGLLPRLTVALSIGAAMALIWLVRRRLERELDEPAG